MKLLWSWGIILLCALHIKGDNLYRPPSLYFPVVEPHDSIPFQWNGKGEYFMKTLKGKNELHFQRYRPTNDYFQSVIFENSHDFSYSQIISKYFIDLNGMWLYKKLPVEQIQLGVEWIPTFFFNHRIRTTDNGIGALLLGPVMKIIPHSVNLPVHFSFGGANNTIYNNDDNFLLEPDDFTDDWGFYTELRVGDYTTPIFKNTPLFAEGKILGRYMNSEQNSQITTGNVDVLFVHDVSIGDTLFVQINDTLSKGRLAFVNESGLGKTEFVSEPNTISNKVNVSLGLTNIGSFAIKPSVFAHGRVESIRYFTDEELAVNNVRIYDGYVAGELSSDSSLSFLYSGGIKISIGKDDHLPGETFKETFEDEEEVALIADKLTKNTLDHQRIGTELYQNLRKDFTSGRMISFKGSYSKSSIRYDNKWIFNSDTTDNVSENRDRGILQTMMQFRYFVNAHCSLGISGEYSLDNTVYLDGVSSAKSMKDRLYNIELEGSFVLPNDLLLRERLGFLAKTSERYFWNMGEQDNAPMSRSVYSKLTFLWNVNDHFNLEAFLGNGFYDRGQVENRDGTLVYVIGLTTFDTSGELKGTFFWNNVLRSSAGFSGRIAFEQDQQVEKTLGNSIAGIVASPFVTFDALILEKVQLSSALKFHKIKNADDYWDITLSIFSRF